MNYLIEPNSFSGTMPNDCACYGINYGCVHGNCNCYQAGNCGTLGVCFSKTHCTGNATPFVVPTTK